MSRANRLIARRFAETMLFWRGHIEAKDVMSFLGVSERTARAFFHDWRAEGLLPPYQVNLGRKTKPHERFDPGSSVTDFNITLALLLNAKHSPGNPFSTTVLPEGGHDLSVTMRSASHQFPSRPVRKILAGCLDRKAVNVIYAAKSGRQEFVFSGFALIRARGRYHLRGHRANGWNAWGERVPDRFIDMVPARAIEAWLARDELFVGAKNDTDWHTPEEREFRLSSELSHAEKLCYENEYGITHEEILKVKQRRALMPYIVQELSERCCWRRDGSSVSVWNVDCSSGSNPK